MTQTETGAIPSPGDNADPARQMLGYKLRMAQILAFRAFEAKLTRHGRAQMRQPAGLIVAARWAVRAAVWRAAVRR